MAKAQRSEAPAIVGDSGFDIVSLFAEREAERYTLHSRYMNEKAWRDMQETTSGEFGGLGIEVTMEDGMVKVVAPMDDTPAAKAGVMSGDLITHINGEFLNQLWDDVLG